MFGSKLYSKSELSKSADNFRTLASSSEDFHHAFAAKAEPAKAEPAPATAAPPEAPPAAGRASTTTGGDVSVLITAASRSNEADKFDEPKSLIKLGGICVMSHVLMQLSKAGVTSAVAILGVGGAELRAECERDKQLFPNLAIDFVDLGAQWRGGHAASILAARAHDAFNTGGGDVLLCPSDHIYDEAILRDLLRPRGGGEPGSPSKGGMGGKGPGAAAATLLVETDLEGMVGLPSTVLNVALRPLHSADRIYQIGKDLGVYSGIGAGLLRCDAARLFAELGALVARVPYCTLGDVLQAWACQGLLLMAKTKGRTWFTVETEGEVAFSEAGLQKVGSSYTLADGRAVQIVGLPVKTKVSPSDGGDWAEFSVAKWRTAMFTAEAYFSQLFDDTSAFIRRFTRQYGGPARAAVVEVGCGTGEALIPHYDDAKYLVGVDFNQARGRVWVGEEGYHLASLGPLPPPMAASQAFPECQYSSLPVVPLPM